MLAQVYKQKTSFTTVLHKFPTTCNSLQQFRSVCKCSFFQKYKKLSNVYTMILTVYMFANVHTSLQKFTRFRDSLHFCCKKRLHTFTNKFILFAAKRLHVVFVCKQFANVYTFCKQKKFSIVTKHIHWLLILQTTTFIFQRFTKVVQACMFFVSQNVLKFLQMFHVCVANVCFFLQKFTHVFSKTIKTSLHKVDKSLHVLQKITTVYTSLHRVYMFCF